MIDYNATYFGRVLNAISQLGNAISGGNPDISISARIGHKYLNGSGNYWVIVCMIVNFTFYPIDGKWHCQSAYFADRKEDYTRVAKGNFIGLIVMTLLMLTICIILIPFTWFYELINKMK